MVAKELNWRFRYVAQDEMEPDDKGRWMVIGSIKVPIELLPKYNKIATLLGNDYINVDIAHIKYLNKLLADRQGYKFQVVMYHIQDANNGLWREFYAHDFEDAKQLAQAKLNHLIACLVQPSQTPPKETIFTSLKSAGTVLWQKTKTLLF